MTDHPAFPDDPLGMALFAELLKDLDDDDEEAGTEEEVDDNEM